jgi:hypothetical protein
MIRLMTALLLSHASASAFDVDRQSPDPRNGASCTASAKAMLRAQLAGPAAADGWKLIETMLCAPKSTASKAFIASRLNRKVRYTSFSSGDENEDLRIVAASAALVDELLAAGETWGAALSINGDEIALHYAPDEACIQTRTLALVKGKWRIAAMGAACD